MINKKLMEENKVIKTTLHELGKVSRCNNRILFDQVTERLDLNCGDNIVKDKVIAEMRTFIPMLIGKLDYTNEQAVSDVLTESFADLKYDSEKQKAEILRRTAMELIRAAKYVNENRLTETGVKVKPVIPKTEDISLGEMVSVPVRPDLVISDKVIVEKADPDGKKNVIKKAVQRIEVIKFKTGKPRTTQARVDKADDTLRMYALLLYARRMVDMYAEPDKDVVIVASEYYLRRNDDRVPLMQENETAEETEERLKAQVFNDFDAVGGGNILSLTETYWKADTREAPVSTIDATYLPKIKEWADGIAAEDCKKEECEKCQIYGACKYARSPKATEKVQSVVNVADICPTEEQDEIMNFWSGIGIVNAGAGVGKTFVITLNVIYMILNGEDPSKIVLVTFTDAASKEMRSRLIRLGTAFGVEEEMLEKVNIFTYHAFGELIVSMNDQRFGFTEVPKVIDDLERSIIINRLINAANIDGLDYVNLKANMRACKGALTMAKEVFDIVKCGRYSCTNEDVEKVRAILQERGELCFAKGDSVKELIKLYDEYDATLKSKNLIEFSDMEVLVQDLLREDPFYLNSFEYEHIIVDEFQDSNEWQIEICKLLTQAPSFKSWLGVGDDSQAIYGFRGTTPYFITHIDDVFAPVPVKHMYLLKNFRCTPEVIEFANAINALCPNRVVKDLIATRPAGKPVFVQGYNDEDEMYGLVVAEIKKHIENGTPLNGGIMVQARMKTTLQKVADRLAAENIPTVMLFPEKLAENSRVIAALAFCGACQNLKDTEGMFTYVNARRMANGESSLLLTDSVTTSDAVEALKAEIQSINDAPFENRKDMVIDMLKAIDTEDEVYESFLQTLAFKTNVNELFEYTNHFADFGADNAVRRINDYPGVILSTIHSAKGLEAKVVFVILDGMDDKALYTGSHQADRMEEMHRLFFVAATRARDELYVVGQYVAYGKKGEYHLNNFLRDSYNAVGKVFDDTTILEQRDLALKKKRGKKTAAKEDKELKAALKERGKAKSTRFRKAKDVNVEAENMQETAKTA